MKQRQSFQVVKKDIVAVTQPLQQTCDEYHSSQIDVLLILHVELPGDENHCCIGDMSDIHLRNRGVAVK